MYAVADIVYYIPFQSRATVSDAVLKLSYSLKFWQGQHGISVSALVDLRELHII